MKYMYTVTKNIDLTNLALVEHKDMKFVKMIMPWYHHNTNQNVMFEPSTQSNPRNFLAYLEPAHYVHKSPS
jgi:hypothetical protein